MGHIADMMKARAPRIRRDEAGRLTILHEDEWVYVEMRPCFPWRRPREYLSLRNDEKEELALVRHLNDLDDESRTAIEAALEEAQFAFTVTGIEAIEKDFEIRIWNVRTLSGPRTFTTKLEDWPEQQGDGRVVIRDLSGDIYVIENLQQMDRKSRDLLWAFVV